MKPIPFEGTSLIPLNRMDKESDLYKSHARKYIGRETLMNEMIPKLNCKWNDVVQFSGLDPQLIVDKLRTIDDKFKLFRTEYFKVHIDQIIGKYESVIFDRSKDQKKGDFAIKEREVIILDGSYREETKVPTETIDFWNKAKDEGGKLLWFPFVPHIFVQGEIDTKDFEICLLK